MKRKSVLKWIDGAVQHILSYQNIRKRLFISSFILVSAVLMSISFLSQAILSNLIMQKQTETEYESFRQVNKYLKTIFSASESYIDTIYKNPSFFELFTEHLDQNDPAATLKYLSKMENIINSFLVNREYIENIVILGQNNVSCRYNQMEERFSTSILEREFVFSRFLKEPELAGYINTGAYPVYFERSNGTSAGKGSYKKIYSLIEKKVIFVRAIRNEKSEIQGIVIMVFNNRLIYDIMNIRDTNYSFFLVSGNGLIVSTNEEMKNGRSFAFNKMLSGEKGTFSKRLEGEEYLYTYDTLAPYEFKIVSSIPYRIAFGKRESISFYSIVFCFVCLLLALAASWFFSEKVTNRLNLLASRLKSEGQPLPNKVDLGGKDFAKRFNLKRGIFTYFIITVIFPTVVFISGITVYNYGIYKDKLIESTSFTVKQIKENIDYKIQSFDEITRQIIFDGSVQSLFDWKSPDGESSDSSKSSVDNLVLNKRIKNKDVLSIGLYNANGDSIYSNLYFDTMNITGIQSNFFEIMEKSEDKLAYTGYNKDFFSMGPVLFFARNAYSLGANYGKKVGYIVISADRDFFYSISGEAALGDRGYIYLTDVFGNIIGGNSISDSNPELVRDNRSLALPNQPGSISFRRNGIEYLAFCSNLDMAGLKIIGIVSRGEILYRVYPLLLLNSLLLLFYIVVILIISTLLAAGIVRPVKKLQGLMEKIQEGELDVHMDYRGRDEIAELAGSFNFMVDKLNLLIYENYMTKLRESELLVLNREAQIKVLQQQIHPHFLYNTLESINWMAYKIGATDIYSMVSALGKFFRGVVSKDEDIITFGEEIEHLLNYIYIQKTRHQDKLEIMMDISEEIREHKTLRLILQPLVENAILHGIEGMKQGAIIKIRGYMEAQSIFFEISDNGRGIPAEKLQELKEIIAGADAEKGRQSGIGLINVYKRLKLSYGERSGFWIDSREGVGTTVKFSMPVSKEVY